MKRIIVATLSTLMLSTLVAPGAEAIRPELSGRPVQSTVLEETTPAPVAERKMERIEKAVIMPNEKASPDKVQSQPNERPSFEYFEKVYREKYGS